MIIKSLLDTDLYKFTTSYAYMKLFPQAMGTFKFNDRDNTIYSEEFLKALQIELCNLSAIRLNENEKDYISNDCRFIPKFYWEWLSSFNFNSGKIKISLDEEGHLQINVTDYMYKVTLYEIPILAIVSELRNKMLRNNIVMEDVINRLKPKISLSNQNQLLFSEFGTRRRFSFSVQDNIVKELAKSATYCTGTSNCYLALKYNLNMIGTHPHEWFMFHGAIYGYKQANYMGLEDWVKVYDGDLGIALSDTYTSKVFLKNLSRKQAKLFDGVRQDSGDEYRFINDVITRYRDLGIDPTTKTIVFSNALTFEKALEIKEYCRNRIRCAFGIGTNLTNDTGFKPSNIVMKLDKCQINANNPEYNCIKISDDLGKHIGNLKEFEIAKHELGL